MRFYFLHTFRRSCALAALLLLLWGCSTKKNGFINRAYHDLTARDNGYFNATLRVQEGVKRLEDANVDRYDRILKVFRYGDVEKAKGVASTMDEAIKKSSLVISRHSMLINGVEHCRWIDDNYMVIGKANFFKRDFFPAIETFQYVVAQYKDQPSHFEALLWMFKTYLEQNQMEDAENLKDYLNGEPNLPKYLKGDVAATTASFYLAQKNYEKATAELNKAIRYTKKRSDKTRYMFILAQIYQRQGEYKKAYEFYSKVIRRNPVYEMAFNAKINKARSFDPAHAKGEAVKAELMKMLKDEKNKEYRDQIYYALGTIAVSEKNTPQGIDYFNLSVRASTTNTGQKALSYLEMATIYYGKPNYLKAQAYYDSTISFLSNDHPDYPDILSRRNNLNKLVKYIHTIQVEDSLQKLASMSPQERDAAIDKIIKKEKEEEERKKREAELLKQQNALLQNNPSSVASTSTTAGWYFYNPGTVSFGFSDFGKRWGNRANEDNWRRSNKESVDAAQADNSEKADTTKGDSSKTDRRAKYYKNLPLGPKQIEKSNNKIIEAYYNLTLMFREDFQDLAESVKYGEELIRRYPENVYRLPVYYSLYIVYTDLRNQPKADFYKNLLLNEYPESIYAHLIQDPDYFSNNKGKLSELQDYYKETFSLVSKGRVEEAKRKIDNADKQFAVNSLRPKFDYLAVLISAKTKGLVAYNEGLKDIIKKYPNDEVAKKAQETLDLLAQMKDRPDLPPLPDKPSVPAVVFVPAPDTAHFCLITFPVGYASDKVKEKLNEYNSKNYGNIPFELVKVEIDAKSQGIVIKVFKDKDAAQDYVYALKQDKALAAEFNKFQLLAITPENLDLLMASKDLNVYLLFYSHNYPEIAHF